MTTSNSTPTSNSTLTYRRNHPRNRCSYGIAGVQGIVVFDLNLFPDGKPPKTITVNFALTTPVAKEPKAVKVVKVDKVAKEPKAAKASKAPKAVEGPKAVKEQK